MFVFLQILGALVAHIGTGIEFEVSSALEIMVSLTSKYSIEMIPISSHINGIRCMHQLFIFDFSSS